MQFSEFTREHLEEILGEWEAFARALPPGQDKDLSGLRPHAQGILLTIADGMASCRSSPLGENESRGKGALMKLSLAFAAKHVGDPQEADFDLEQVVAEYRALRASVLRVWTRRMKSADAPGLEELTRFNDEIDQALAYAIREFERRAASKRKELGQVLRENEARYRALINAASQVVYRMSPDWREMRQLHGQDFIVDARQSNDTWLDQYIHPDDQAQVLRTIRKAIRSKSVFELEHRVRRLDGSYGWAHSRAVPRFDENGRITEWIGAASDVTERHQAEKALRDSEERYRTLEAGRWADFLFIEVICFTPDDGGSETWFLVSTAPFRDAGGRVTGAVAIMQDCTELRHAEQALRQSEERLRLALSAARMGTWTWQASSDRHRRDANLNQLLGLEAAETVLPIEAFFAQVYVEDRDRVRAAYATSLREGRNLHVDFRVLWPTGEVRWLSDQGDVYGSGDERYLAGACLDITDRKLLEEELQAADRRKDEFLATLAHELRNPMAPIQTGIEVLRLTHDKQGAAGDAIAMMSRQIRHLVRLVDDLLDISRVSRGKITLRRETVDVREAITKALEATRAFTQTGQRQVFVSCPTHPLPVNADPVRLVQILSNLLSNAGKYTNDRGRIWISAAAEGSRIRIRVRDDGLGLAPEAQKHLFKMFMQVDTQRSGGLGIGLALVRSLMELHGGSVTAYSEGLGKGSEFTLCLPAVDGSEAPPVQRERDNRPVMTGHRILIVDDNKDAATALSTLLSLLGAEVQMAHEGRTALALFEQFAPDLVLLDLGMPEMDGFEVAKQIRSLPDGRQVQLVALTGWGQEDDLRRTQQAGFDAHLVKPIETKDLGRVLRLQSQGVPSSI